MSSGPVSWGPVRGHACPLSQSCEERGAVGGPSGTTENPQTCPPVMHLGFALAEQMARSEIPGNIGPSERRY